MSDLSDDLWQHFYRSHAPAWECSRGRSSVPKLATREAGEWEPFYRYYGLKGWVQELLMRTNISIDNEIINHVMQYTKASSKAKAVRLALAEYLHQQRKQQLIDLRGTLDIEDNWHSIRKLEIKESVHD